MTTSSNKLTIGATSRPLRVVYLVDADSCPNALLDAIFKEAYGRWGGRRTLIVPAKLDGVDARYREWLWYYDADVFCSFVALTDGAVAAVHERYCPARLGRRTSGSRPSIRMRWPGAACPTSPPTRPVAPATSWCRRATRRSPAAPAS